MNEMGRPSVASPLQQYGDSKPHLGEDRGQGHPVVRAPQNLRLHPALLDLGYTAEADELSDSERVRQHPTAPIPITSEGVILSGFGRWRSAVLHKECEIPCIQYDLSEEESLQFILAHHKPHRGWNSFVRTRLALDLEPYLQRRALDNMRGGGRHKGLAKLPNPQHIDVRRELADIAGVGARNVSNVKLILKGAHPRLLSALRDGTLTINRAVRLCKLPIANQLETFTQELEERAIDVVIRRAVKQSHKQERCPNAAPILAALLQYEFRFPGSVPIRRDRCGRITISIGNDLVEQINSQGELQLDETARSAEADTHSITSSLGPE